MIHGYKGACGICTHVISKLPANCEELQSCPMNTTIPEPWVDAFREDILVVWLL